MDITKLSDEKSQDDVAIDLPVVGRDGEPSTGSDGTPTVFKVLARNSAPVRRVIDRQARQNARRRSELTPKEAYGQRVERGAAALVGWTGVDNGGSPIAINPDAVQAVLSDPHYLEQVEDGMVNHGRFFKTASAS